MTVVVTNLPKVMDIFSDILSKSRFEQRPIPGNFSPRPNPKKNTTKGTKPTSLTKEFKPVPGTYNYRRDPDSTAKPKGKTAERELISDGATSDDATFVEGLEKSDRTIQQAKKADKARNRDAGQAAMQGRQERLTGMRPTLMTTEMRDTRPLGYMATDPEKVGIIRGQRRRANRRLDSEEARRSVSDTTKKRQAAMSAAEITGRIQKAVYGYLHKNRRPIRQKANQEKLKGLLDAGRISQEGYDDVMSGKRGSAPAIRTGLDRAQRDGQYRKDMGLDILVSEAASRAAKFRREGYPKGGTDYRTGKKPAAEEDKPHVDTQGTLDLGMLKAFGVMKAESREGTYTPADYKSKNTVDSVVRRSQRKSGFNPPPTGNQNLQVRSPRVNVDEETYEDVDTKTKIRDESYQSGKPQANILSRRGGSATGYAHHTADTGPAQGFMDVGTTGASAKSTGRTAITARDEDRSRGKDLKYKRGPQSGASDTGLGIRESEDKRKKEQAALSPEERAKTPLQRLQEADRKRALSQKQILIKAFGVMKSTGGRHGLHPVERRPKTVTEKADGGEEYSSGARGRTPALLGMAKALADGMTPEQKKRIMDKVKNVASRYDEFPKKPENPKKSPQKELPFSTEDRDNIAPTPDPHGDNLPEPKQRGGTRQGSKRHGEIPKEGWKEAALLYPAHRKEQQGGRKVKTRVGDSPTGYPT